ncbi:hypothetical protein [Longimicrobium sp.]|uniref:hypothetical protein n=1 Tax=Longimicrobium sp. TaxID=2029185 RepID=UPI002CB04D0E|nr:hypothetical protein [Longimicrobium sp.]HSU16146.1 hypothetical protein [Longimicrobium sp.]
MRRLLRAALALLLAAPALHHPHSAAAAQHAGVRPRDEVYAAAASHRGTLAQAPVPKRGAQPASGPDLHPPAFIPASATLLPRAEAGGTHLRPSRIPVPRSAKRPAYYATAPPR